MMDTNDQHPRQKTEAETQFQKLLEIPGRTWTDDEMKIMQTVLNGQEFRIRFLLWIKRAQENFTWEMVEDCWQSFCEKRLKKCLASYDPAKGQFFDLFKKAIQNHGKTFYKQQKKQLDSGKDNKNVSIYETQTEVIQPLNEKLKNKQDPSTELEAEQLFNAVCNFLMELPEAERYIFQCYSPLFDNMEQRPGSISESEEYPSKDISVQIADQMAKNGLLTRYGKAYRPNNVRTTRHRLRKQLAIYLKKRGVVDEAFTRPRNKKKRAR
ncbi:MAG: hypothetical protein ACRERV_05115 [Methylococcales bacterium]